MSNLDTRPARVVVNREVALRPLAEANGGPRAPVSDLEEQGPAAAIRHQRVGFAARLNDGINDQTLPACEAPGKLPEKAAEHPVMDGQDFHVEHRQPAEHDTAAAARRNQVQLRTGGRLPLSDGREAKCDMTRNPATLVGEVRIQHAVTETDTTSAPTPGARTCRHGCPRSRRRGPGRRPMRTAILALLLGLAARPAAGQAYPSLTFDTTPPRSEGSPGDASSMSARPSGSAAARTFAQWFGDRANVLAFPGADLSARFAAACASLPASGGTIYIPGRVYTSSGRLACDGKAVNVVGDGPGVTVIQFTSAAPGRAGLSAAPGDAVRPVTIRDLSLITLVDQVGGNAALTLRYGSAPSNVFKGPRVTNVEMAGAANNTTYWAGGVDAYNVWGFDFHGLHVRGKDVGAATVFPAANMGAAIRITGENGGGCSDGKIVATQVVFARYAGYVSGDCEGLHWVDNTGVAVDQGIAWPDARAHPGFFISRNHFNAFRRGVAVAGATQGIISDNLLYKWTGSAQPFAGISLTTHAAGGSTFFTTNTNVHHNTIVGYAGGGARGGEAIGIDVSGGDGNILQGNQFLTVDYAFDFGGVSSANTAADNTAVGTVSGWQKRVGLKTISRNNTPIRAGTDPWFVPLTGGGAFNVGAWFQTMFLATGEPGTTYTDFTHAEAGRQITIIGQDGHSTIAHNARIRLRGGANFTTSAGSSLTLVHTGDYWLEIGRSQ